jgi:hypothetical protein
MSGGRSVGVAVTQITFYESAEGCLEILVEFIHSAALSVTVVTEITSKLLLGLDSLHCGP